MKICGGCSHEFEDDFKFCPECGRPFGGEQAADLKRKLDQHLFNMKQAAGREGAISRQVFSGGGLGDRNFGRVYGQETNADL